MSDSTEHIRIGENEKCVRIGSSINAKNKWDKHVKAQRHSQPSCHIVDVGAAASNTNEGSQNFTVNELVVMEYGDKTNKETVPVLQNSSNSTKDQNTVKENDGETGKTAQKMVVIHSSSSSPASTGKKKNKRSKSVLQTPSNSTINQDIARENDGETGKTAQTIVVIHPSSSLPAATGGRGVVTSFEEIKKDVKSTIKTLSLILMYLAISLPTYITATVHRDCYCIEYDSQGCVELRKYLYVFRNVSLVGHIAFPCTWLFFDKMYGDKLLKTLRIIRDAH